MSRLLVQSRRLPFAWAMRRRLRRSPSAGILATLREWRQRCRSRFDLAGFDDRMLRDIGLTRGDSEWEINKPFWRE